MFLVAFQFDFSWLSNLFQLLFIIVQFNFMVFQLPCIIALFNFMLRQ